MDSKIILGRLLQRFIDEKSSQYMDYNKFGLIEVKANSIIVSRENGSDTPIPFKKLVSAIEAYQNSPDLYDTGPSSLRNIGLTHITSPIHSILHLLPKEIFSCPDVPMKAVRVNDAFRKKSIGDFGESFAIKALQEKGYINIQNLNSITNNSSFADILAQKDGKQYVISVKARNKYRRGAGENDSYNLGKDHFVHAKRAETIYNAEAYWMAIAFDIKTFSVYLGSLKELNMSKYISIPKCKKGIIGECLVLDKEHNLDWSSFTNQR